RGGGTAAAGLRLQRHDRELLARTPDVDHGRLCDPQPSALVVCRRVELPGGAPPVPEGVLRALSGPESDSRGSRGEALRALLLESDAVVGHPLALRDVEGVRAGSGVGSRRRLTAPAS